jgi:hypothetical protein
MDVGPITTKVSRTLVLSRTPEPFALEGVKLSEIGHLQDTRRERRESALRESLEIARVEMTRRRRRLGKLTPEQESAIETLLISTVSKVSEIAIAVRESLDLYPTESEEKINATK